MPIPAVEDEREQVWARGRAREGGVEEGCG